jgi:hypothetical protein
MPLKLFLATVAVMITVAAFAVAPVVIDDLARPDFDPSPTVMKPLGHVPDGNVSVTH